jgi:hypothetical protein
VAFRCVAASTHPDHDTLATFRGRFLTEVEKLFVQVLVLAREMNRSSSGTSRRTAREDCPGHTGALMKGPLAPCRSP